MKEIIFATANPNKIREIKSMLAGRYTILGLDSINCTEDIPETRDTIIGNALQKAEYIVEHYGVNCFSEDSGLEIDALEGAPGVYSARYAGPEKNSDANISLVLSELKGKNDRGAQFRTVIALYLDGQMHTFEGIIRGKILNQRRGTGGFGYDPIFLPDGYDQTFGEMNADQKNLISHRAIAVRKLQDFLVNKL